MISFLKLYHLFLKCQIIFFLTAALIICCKILTCKKSSYRWSCEEEEEEDVPGGFNKEYERKDDLSSIWLYIEMNQRFSDSVLLVHTTTTWKPRENVFISKFTWKWQKENSPSAPWREADSAPLIIFKVDRWKPHWCWGLHFVLFVSADSSPSQRLYCVCRRSSLLAGWIVSVLASFLSPRTAVNRSALGLKTLSSRTHNSWEEQWEPAGTDSLFMLVNNWPRLSLLLASSI